MKIIRHLTANPFITFTGVAALIHSTWALGTLFAGNQPQGWHLLGWIVPALLVALALDVGQINTSWEIRHYGLTWARAITFAVFALATYYLQWLYIIHHMPSLPLAPGISSIWQDIATQGRDLAMFILPALLPASTLLYTFSSQRHNAESETVVSTSAVQDENANLHHLDPLNDADLLTVPRPPAPTFAEVCPDCGWASREYDNPDSAARALRTHQSMHCEMRGEVQHGFAE